MNTIAVTIPAPVTVATKAAIVAAIASRTGRPFEVLISTGSTVEIATTMRRVGTKTIEKWKTAVRVAIRPRDAK